MSGVAPEPIPVTLVSGFLGAGKSALIRHWLDHKPQRERWAVLVNDSDGAGVAARGAGSGAGAPAEPAADSVSIFELAGGCACCAALPALRARLPQVLRSSPWQRLIIELSGTGHPAPLIDLLRAAPFDQRLIIEQVVAVVDAGRAGPYLSFAAGDAEFSGAGSPSSILGAELARAQIESAELVVINHTERADAGQLRRLAEALAHAPPFGREVSLCHTGRQDWPAMPAAGRIGGPPQGPPQGPAGPPGRALPRDGWMEQRARPAALEAVWRWPAAVRFDRRKLRAALQQLATLPELSGADAACGTERAWYRWHHSDRIETWEASAYRSENRLLATFLVPGLDHAPVLERILAWQAQLLAALAGPD